MDDKKPETTVPFFARQAAAAIPVRSAIRAGTRESGVKREEMQKLG